MFKCNRLGTARQSESLASCVYAHALPSHDSFDFSQDSKMLPIILATFALLGSGKWFSSSHIIEGTSIFKLEPSSECEIPGRTKITYLKIGLCSICTKQMVRFYHAKWANLSTIPVLGNGEFIVFNSPQSVKFVDTNKALPADLVPDVIAANLGFSTNSVSPSFLNMLTLLSLIFLNAYMLNAYVFPPGLIMARTS
jgi:hypothetical protein